MNDWVLVIALSMIGLAVLQKMRPALFSLPGRTPPKGLPDASRESRRQALLQAAEIVRRNSRGVFDPGPGDAKGEGTEAEQAGGVAASTDIEALLAAEHLFDPDTLAEMRAAAEAWDRVWSRFGRPERPTPDQRHHLDPARALALVRHLRALDEQLRREKLAPAPRPEDWDTFYAGGRLDLPPPPWPLQKKGARADSEEAQGRQGAAPPPRAPHGRAWQRRWKRLEGHLLSLENNRVATRLAQALAEEAAQHPVIAPIGLEAVPPEQGNHRAYSLEPWPWGQPYLHLFAGESVSLPEGRRARAELLLSFGLKGGLYRYGAVLIEPDPPVRPWEGLRRTKKPAPPGPTLREQGLKRAGYDVYVFTPSQIKSGAQRCARSILDAAGVLLRDVAETAAQEGEPPSPKASDTP